VNTEEIERNYLEIRSLNELLQVEKPNNKIEIFPINPPDFQINKFFYKQVGIKYMWRDRLIWNDKTWIDYTTHKNVKTFVLKKENDLVGYFELILNKEKFETEIAYFGILEYYFGKKYGGYLLSEAIKISFKEGSKRVWVHTCSLDHKNGIKNYLARGMKIFRSEKITLNN
tara:strand:+ start:139 stop:651 length:513 start_codon:yes stop_codon:yes gene_type:complete